MSHKVTFSDPNKVISRLGLKPGQNAHKFFMRRGADRMAKYVPYRQNGSIEDALLQGIDYQRARYVLRGPHQRYQYYGKLMVDPKTGKGAFHDPISGRFWSRPGVAKVLTSKNLQYTKTPHPKAGPRYDVRMMEAEGDQLAAEVSAFIKKGG